MSDKKISIMPGYETVRGESVLMNYVEEKAHTVIDRKHILEEAGYDVAVANNQENIYVVTASKRLKQELCERYKWNLNDLPRECFERVRLSFEQISVYGVGNIVVMFSDLDRHALRDIYLEQREGLLKIEFFVK